ncbi:hypothetical protein ACFWTE_06235 [Nocardiopsis sp. NPDC058631]|uniref:hypothetical protein n=1 Tax=Nocardiopsis sp. NPDC058631 TaxID=3346566 RepID=UPI003667AF79
MRQFSAALLSRALSPLTALLTPPRGRHASATGRRRRRSTRVRRYAPVPAPVEATTPPPRVAPATGHPKPLPPARLLTPPHERFPADDLALVRPYFEAHERELDRVGAEAAERLRRWSRASAPLGDLLAAEPVPVPAPRAPSPNCEDPDDWRTFTRLTRVWLDQQDRRSVAA